MRTAVVVHVQADTRARVAQALASTSAVLIDAGDIVDVAVAVAAERNVAAVVLEESDDVVATRIARLMPAEERHRLVVVRQGDNVDTAVPWTVVRRSELRLTLPPLIEGAEAVVVELLTSVRPHGAPTGPARIGCVVSVGSHFIIVALDDPPEHPVVSFVLPGAGRQSVGGALVPVPGRTGLWRLTPDDDAVRAALMAFTLRRSESAQRHKT